MQSRRTPRLPPAAQLPPTTLSPPALSPGRRLTPSRRLPLPEYNKQNCYGAQNLYQQYAQGHACSPFRDASPLKRGMEQARRWRRVTRGEGEEGLATSRMYAPDDQGQQNKYLYSTQLQPAVYEHVGPKQRQARPLEPVDQQYQGPAPRQQRTPQKPSIASELIEKSQLLKQRMQRIMRMTPRGTRTTTPEKPAAKHHPEPALQHEPEPETVQAKKYCWEKLPLETIQDCGEPAHDSGDTETEAGLHRITRLSRKISDRLQDIISKHSL